jgi:hypothetical protein
MSIPISNFSSRRERRARWAWRRQALWELFLASLLATGLSAQTEELHRYYVDVPLDNPYRGC